ncbi:class I adenylate-forming enzyme family protein [Treponema sp.]|uniref:class I adenylate-forming enzyme family protein n=1 Tax=Treponema sp. TaxID=166 RepID=UPI00298EC6C5|nr:class I adenylate-forming enzyme family protein [Treponema sp.]MCQ2240677.1 acyl--CoA ligase [Treponema sp.]
MDRTYNDEMFIDTFEHGYTWLNGFLRNVNRYGNKQAVIDPEANLTWTYSQLNRESNRLANALIDCGTKKNDVVMAALKNCPEFCTSYIGPRKAGAILLAANTSLAYEEMSQLIDHNKPKVIIYSAVIKDTVINALKICKHEVELAVMADNIAGESIPDGHVSYEDFTKNKSEEEPTVEFRPHIYDEVLRLCTSGTTALPKCVPINDINEVLSAHDVIMHYPMDCNDVTLNMTPWFHRGGVHSGGPCPTFYIGGAVIVMRTFKPQTALDWVAKYKITYIMGAPANLEMLARSQERNSRNLSSIRGIITMGGPLTRSDCIRYMGVLTPNIFNGYGTTETFWNSFLRPYNLPAAAGSVGYSCVDDETKIVKASNSTRTEPDDTVPMDGKTEGEIIIRCPEKTTYSYYGNPEAEKEKFYKGWMYTGDMGTWDKNGLVTVCGRMDDMMLVSGENIYPQQVEEAIMRNPKVLDCIVTSVPDSVRGQAVVAYVIPKDGTLTIEELKEFCNNSPILSRYKRPRYYAFTDKIPQTATGKKQHSLMKKQALEDFSNGKLIK